MVVGEPTASKALHSRSGNVTAAGARPAASLQPSHKLHKSVTKTASNRLLLRDVVMDLAFSSNKWYAATSSGLLVSTDRGANWSRMPVGPLASLPAQAVRASADGLRLRVASLRGLVFSDDGGASWTWHDLPYTSGGAVSLDAQSDDPNTLVAIARNGLYISRDAGNTWQQAASGLPATPVQGFAASGGVFVASMSTGGIYVSADSGHSWDRVPETPAGGFFSAIATSDESGVIFAASATEGLFRVQWPDSLAKRVRYPSSKSESRTGFSLSGFDVP
jgi:photosystem II stability/assembly factor-like uncharacterized protein